MKEPSDKEEWEAKTHVRLGVTSGKAAFSIRLFAVHWLSTHAYQEPCQVLEYKIN